MEVFTKKELCHYSGWGYFYSEKGSKKGVCPSSALPQAGLKLNSP